MGRIGKPEYVNSEDKIMKYHRLTEDEKYIITEWKYEGDYAIYNDQPYDEQKKKGWGLPIQKIFYSHSMKEVNL